jgi:hypothetical protein
MGPGVQPKRTKIRKRYGSISYAPSKQQHERCHKGKWTTSSKQKAKACLRRQTSYQDIVSHSQRFTILRITITSGWRQAREPCCSGNVRRKALAPKIPSQLLTARALVPAGVNRAWARVFSSAFRLSNSRSTFFHSRGFFLVTNGFSRSA